MKVGRNFRSRDLYGEGGASIFSALSFLVIFVGLAYLIFFELFGYTIPPGYLGVRQIKIGPGQGFSKEGLAPGKHWGVPGGFYTIVHLIPQTIQSLHFHSAAGESEGDEDSTMPSLEVQSADRATVDVDVTILTRFLGSPGQEENITHGGPSDLLQLVGLSPERWQNHVRRTAEDEIKRALGKISTGDFYNPKIREEGVAEAAQNMNKSLLPYGVKVEAVLLRRFAYRDDRIDLAIFQKNLQQQEERLNEALSRYAEAQAALEQVAAEWDAKIETLRVEGENNAKVIQSEGDLYQNQMQAKGDLEVATARAEVDKLKAEALGSSAGSEAYVARELASVAGSLKGGVVSGLDPYDFQAWMDRFGVGNKQLGGRQ